MTALYCYIVSSYDYDYNDFLPIFHSKKFTKKEFQKICDEIKNKIKSNETNQYDWSEPSIFLKYAMEYGFCYVDILEVETINFKVKEYDGL